jgi:hypothetical protein
MRGVATDDFAAQLTARYVADDPLLGVQG